MRDANILMKSHRHKSGYSFLTNKISNYLRVLSGLNSQIWSVMSGTIFTPVENLKGALIPLG